MGCINQWIRCAGSETINIQDRCPPSRTRIWHPWPGCRSANIFPPIKQFISKTCSHFVVPGTIKYSLLNLLLDNLMFLCWRKTFSYLQSFRTSTWTHHSWSRDPHHQPALTSHSLAASSSLWLRCRTGSFQGEMDSGNARIWSVRDPTSWGCEWRQNRTLNRSFKKVCTAWRHTDDGC